MRAEDLTVEVRDKTLARLGQIPASYLNLTKCTARDSAVGEWALTIPADHPLATPLRTPGAGIIVTLASGEVFLSGPMTKATSDSTYSDTAGVLTVEGVTDEIVLWDALAWPDPDLPIGEQGDYDLWLGDLSLDPLGALGSFLSNLGRLPVGSLGYGMTFGGLMAPATVLFSDDFNRADSTTVGNGWTRYNPELGGGIIDGTLAVVDDHNDYFERTITLPESWRISWTVASTAPSVDREDAIEMQLHVGAEATNWPIGRIGFARSSDPSGEWGAWITVADDTTDFALSEPITVGDVLAVTRDASGMSLSVNGASLGTKASPTPPAILSIGLVLTGTGAGTRLAVDDFTVEAL